MTRDGEVQTIFNPKRVRTPSVVVTGDSPNGPYGGFTQINQSDPGGGSVCGAGTGTVSNNNNNQPDGCENVVIPTSNPNTQTISTVNTITTTSITTNTNNSTDNQGDSGNPTTNTTEIPPRISIHRRRLKACEQSCCSELAQKMYFGVCVTVLVTASWVGATHCIKFLYLNRNAYTIPEESTYDGRYNALYGPLSSEINNQSSSTSIPDETIKIRTEITMFNAPFFASWFCTNFAFLFFPIYLLGRVALRKCDKPGDVLGDVLRGFRDRGFTIGRFLNRCMCFCFLWVFTTYLYALSLRALLATDVLALFATNVGCVYLLSWVILHEQFVGVRIVAVILCDTGIALLAYMDGITGSPTLGGVVLAALAAAGYAVFKVMFRKVMGDAPIGQIAFTFTTLGFLNVATLWPICVGLYLTGNEVMPSDRLPWVILLIASVLLLVFHILTQFSAAVTYNMFVTLGLITAVPVSGALDVVLYGAQFAGMKLAGIILIAVGFFLVMFPENWPDYITRLLRKTGRAILLYQCCCDYGEIEYDKSKYHLVGAQREMGTRGTRKFSSRSTSYHHRLSDGLYTFPSPISVRACEMTDQSFQSNYNNNNSSNITSNSNNALSPSEFDYSGGISSSSKRKRHSYIAGIPVPSTSTGGGANNGNGLFLSYFDCNEPTKKKETPFINFGFRRKSSVFYAATD